ncbi:MaoC/PaaZ C-terminal domain-containing protein [Natrinema salsiterrestre]|uniref:Dehydratase n=1 Tax=Natrinema salsiterrestre TaxID=2950540 RepID=A0A9Q4L044_9EURY|nr:MaoC/PaaZ C-terminal domain-containing protein [Natrinema salsiterrestre]MDF9745059.1 dehydratase [Natrinema salsiterrestre]
MSMSMPPEEGDVHTYERTFTTEDVRQFGEVSGDQQTIHTEPDEDGRLVVQGLLTATLPTKIGGDLSYIARTMEFNFHQPVYTENAIRCEWTNESVEERDDRYTVTSSVVCTNEDDETVMEASINGLIWKE